MLDVTAMLRRAVPNAPKIRMVSRLRKSVPQLASHTEHLEDRQMLTADLFVVPGTPEDLVKISFLLTERQTKLQNEVGYYVVDDATGRVDGQQPGTAEYARAVLNSPDRHILFPSGSQTGPADDITVTGGTQLAFYLVKDSSSQTLLTRDHHKKFPKNPEIYFSAEDTSADKFDHVHTQSGQDGSVQFLWKDKKKDKDPEFNDAVFTVTPTVVQVNFFSDLEAFQDASTTSVVENFETAEPTATNIATPFTLGDLTFTSFSGDPSPSVFLFPLNYGNGNEFGVALTSTVLTSSGTEDFEIAFASPPTAVGFDSITNFSTTKPIVSVYDTDGAVIGTYTLTQEADSIGFVGITSTVPIGKVRWTAAEGEIENTGIDNIRLGTANL